VGASTGNRPRGVPVSTADEGGPSGPPPAPIGQRADTPAALPPAQPQQPGRADLPGPPPAANPQQPAGRAGLSRPPSTPPGPQQPTAQHGRAGGAGANAERTDGRNWDAPDTVTPHNPARL